MGELIRSIKVNLTLKPSTNCLQDSTPTPSLPYAVAPLDLDHSIPQAQFYGNDATEQPRMKGNGRQGGYVGNEANEEQPLLGAIVVGFGVTKSRLIN